MYRGSGRHTDLEDMNSYNPVDKIIMLEIKFYPQRSDRRGVEGVGCLPPYIISLSHFLCVKDSYNFLNIGMAYN